MIRNVPGARYEYLVNTLRDARKILEGCGVQINDDRWREVADWLRDKTSKQKGWQAAYHYLDLLKDAVKENALSGNEDD